MQVSLPLLPMERRADGIYIADPVLEKWLDL